MTTLALGVIMLALYVPLVLTPGLSRKAWTAFPRCAPVGWILTVISVSWFAWHVYQTPFGRLEHLKSLVWPAVPFASALIIVFVDDLLAARALGMVLLLVPAPLLVGMRMTTSNFRYVVVILAYAMALKGMVLVMSPFRFRKAAAWWLRNDTWCRVVGGIGAAFAALVTTLALIVF